MTLAEFIKKYIGKKVDFDGAFGAQCVDLFRQYNRDVWDNPHTGVVEGAKDLFLNFDKMPEEKKFLKIVESPYVGDVIVWGPTEKNPFGHVGMLVGAVDGNSFLVFEQDGFRQDGAKINIRDKSNVLGYLRKK